MLKRSLFLIFLVIGLMCGSACAAISETTFSVVVEDEPHATWDMVTSNVTNNDVLEEVEPSVWHFKTKKFFIINSTLDIENVELRFDEEISLSAGTYAFDGGYYIDSEPNCWVNLNNVTVSSWNSTSGTYSHTATGVSSGVYPNTEPEIVRIKTQSLKDVTFKNMRRVWILNSDSAIIENIYFDSCVKGFHINRLNNSIISNVTAINTTNQAIHFTEYASENVTISNVYDNHGVDSYKSEVDSADGIGIGSCTDITISNITVINAPWSGIRVANSYRTTIDDFDIIGAGHVALDLHPSNGGTFTNFTMDDFATEGVLMSGTSGFWCNDNIVAHGYANSTGGRSYEADAYVSNNTFIDIISDGYVTGGGGIEFFDCDNMTVIGFEQWGTQHAYGLSLDSAGATSDIYLFDSNLTNATTNDIWFEGSVHTFNILGNINYVSFDNDNPTTNIVYRGYYPNLKVVDNNGTGIAGATVTFDNPVRNAWGDVATEFMTDSNGYLSIVDRSQMPLMNESVEYVITAHYGNESANVTGVQANSTWFSLDTSNLQGNLITIPLDVGELIILSYLPTDTTPSSTNGTEQTFTTNFSKTVDSAGWYINGTLVEWDNSTTIASYSNSTAPVGTYNVTVIATDGVTEVNQTWIWTVVDITEYWTPTEGYSYIGIPETWTWTDGAFVHNYTYGQILPEDAPERVTGVEVMP
jgi:hypothetical protein